MPYETLLLDRPAEGVAVVTMNRPESLNAMNLTLRQELEQAMLDLDEDADVRAIVLTGAGPRAFSAGGDIHERVKAAGQSQHARPGSMAGGMWRIANLKKPTVGAMNGLAFGGAAMLASTLDIRIGCERSSFRFLAASYGLINSTWTLPLLVGWAQAKELLYTGRIVEAEEAFRIGLLNNLVPAAEVLDAAVQTASQIAANRPEAVQGIKRLLHQQVGLSWQEQLATEQGLTASELPFIREADRFKPFLERGKQRSV